MRRLLRHCVSYQTPSNYPLCQKITQLVEKLFLGLMWLADDFFNRLIAFATFESCPLLEHKITTSWS